ncbi:hypothetical protein BDP27DRAFT_1434861 [Rhodocollybia butyracea]|uniref:Uncharacterized protein n=1 Tax=Rhodocollybia butyracea TaxID=206335 RepID=A0A9P5TVL9_9AGAR|nr:hypothetical protein BDP27DRAFT_1434861 [Rhodocollybia butyracea]
MACSSRLELLTVQYEPWDCTNEFNHSVFLLFKLPSLKTLRLEKSKLCKDVQGIWDNLEPFTMFLHQTSLQLTSFSIQGFCITDTKLIQILVYLPTLRDLTVDDSHIVPTEFSPISSKFIESLHGHHHSSSLRPRKP